MITNDIRSICERHLNISSDIKGIPLRYPTMSERGPTIPGQYPTTPDGIRRNSNDMHDPRGNSARCERCSMRFHGAASHRLTKLASAFSTVINIALSIQDLYHAIGHASTMEAARGEAWNWGPVFATRHEPLVIDKSIDKSSSLFYSYKMGLVRSIRYQYHLVRSMCLKSDEFVSRCIEYKAFPWKYQDIRRNKKYYKSLPRYYDVRTNYYEHGP